MHKSTLPILQKLSNLLKMSIFAAKMRKPFIAKLLLLKKSRQLKRFKLLKNYKRYRFVEEYQFAASTTPLIHHHRKHKHYSKNRRSLEDIYSMFFLCTCFGGSEAADNYSFPIETIPAITAGEFLEPQAVLGLDLEDEEDSVDERAERFIQWFYQEMRMQRQDSF